MNSTRGDPVPASPRADEGSAAGVMRHAELAEVAARVNVMHRQAKRAQKDCSDLYLLLLLHKCACAGLMMMFACSAFLLMARHDLCAACIRAVHTTQHWR